MPIYKVTDINWLTSGCTIDELRSLPSEMTVEAPSSDRLDDAIFLEVGFSFDGFSWEEVLPITRKSYEEAVRAIVSELAFLVPPADMKRTEGVKIVRSVLKEYGVLCPLDRLILAI